MTGAVPIWETDRSLHPTLTIVAASSARDLAQALAAGLEGAGYELSGVTPEGFSARHADRVIVKILKPVEATVLEVAVSAGVAQHPQFAQATIRVCGGTQRRSGVRSASAGLSQAVATIEHRGVEVKVRPWDYDTAGSADDEVPGWDKNLRSFHPQMTVRSPTAAPTVVDALARSLQGAGYKVSRRSAAGFRARHHNWLRFGLELATFVGASADRTTLDIGASTDHSGAVVTIRVAGGFEHWGPRDRAARGLTVAVRELRSQGHQVEVTPWAAE